MVDEWLFTSLPPPLTPHSSSLSSFVLAQSLTLVTFYRALPILRQLGTQGGAGVLMHGGEIDFSMIKVWAGLEARKFFQASVQSVENCVSYDQLSPNI